MNRFVSSAALLAGIALFAAPAHAQQVTGFVGNPRTNSTDWSDFVSQRGASINTNINFDSHPVGALQGTFYLGSEGVTLTGTTGVNTIATGAGPDEFGSLGFNQGEGLHPASNYLSSNGTSELTISFDTPVSGFGLFTIDYYNFNGNVPLTISAYSTAGNLLETFNSLSNISFQQNYLYFMGVATTDGSNGISKVVFANLINGDGDVYGLDGFRFSRVSGSATAAAPEPGTLALALMGLPLAGGIVRRRTRRAK